MSRYRKFNTPEAINKLVREGRGTGVGPTYQRWLNIWDVPSKGRRHRIYCTKVGRELHLLSDLERRCAFVGEYMPEVVDIQEQFPLLPLWETQQIAIELGIRHPRDPGTRRDIVMTTDQVWTMVVPGVSATQAMNVKYGRDQRRRRVIEKRAIEEEYWGRRGVELVDFHEHSISQSFIRNWWFIRRTLRPGFREHLPHEFCVSVDRALRQHAMRGSATLSALAAMGAQIFGVDNGAVLNAIHQLIATRAWEVDILTERLLPTRRICLPRAA